MSKHMPRSFVFFYTSIGVLPLFRSIKCNKFSRQTLKKCNETFKIKFFIENHGLIAQNTKQQYLLKIILQKIDFFPFQITCHCVRQRCAQLNFKKYFFLKIVSKKFFLAISFF